MIKPQTRTWSIAPICEGYGLDRQSGHIQESTNECMNKWNNKSVFLSLHPPLLLPSSLKKNKQKN